MTNELIALANGREMGSVVYRNARLSFIYEESWRQDDRSYPLSLSMPLASAEHGHSRIERYLGACQLRLAATGAVSSAAAGFRPGSLR
jgi:serine/threonine-protein kinase HipA